MVTYRKLFVLGGDLVGLYSPIISPEDYVITDSKKAARSLSKKVSNVFLIDSSNIEGKSRSIRFRELRKSIEDLGPRNFSSIRIAVFQEDIQVGNLLIPLMHKMITTKTPFFIEHRRLTIDTFALLKELTVIGVERNVYIINRQSTPSSSKLRKLFVDAIIEGTAESSGGIYSIAIKRYKLWEKLKKWIKDAETLIKNNDLNRIPDNYKPYIQSLKSRISEARMYVNGTRFTRPLQGRVPRPDGKLEVLTIFGVKPLEKVYCYTGVSSVKGAEDCIRLEYLSDEVIYLAFPRLEPVFPYEQVNDEVLHIMRLYDKAVSNEGYEAFHPLNPGDLVHSVPKARFQSWDDVVLFLTDPEEMKYIIDKLKESLRPLITLKNVVNQCEDTYICEENYKADREVLRKMLQESISSYDKLVDEYLRMMNINMQPDDNIVNKIESNLATLIISVTDDDFKDFITRNYENILRLIIKLSQVNELD